MQQQQSKSTSSHPINSNSIVTPFQLVLVLILVLSSLSHTHLKNTSSHNHVKNMRDYFISKILGNDWMGLYDQGNNIDEAKVQIVDYTQMNKHFEDMVDIVKNFTEFDSFSDWTQLQQQNVQWQFEFRNGTYQATTFNLEQLQQFIQLIDLRQSLINAREIKLNIMFGKNQRLQNCTLQLIYTVHSKAMLEVHLEIAFIQSIDYDKTKHANTMRIFQQIFAGLLLLTYLRKLISLFYARKQLMLQIEPKSSEKHKLNLLKKQSINRSSWGSGSSQQMRTESESHEKTLITNQIQWCLSLIVLNLVSIISWKLAPIGSLLQLLPIFQTSTTNPSSTRSANDFTLNTNLRYALPIVLRIFIPVLIFLNGFIMYSVLMYPGDYFDDYLMGFFSYLFQNFQVGTYQIFIQLKDQDSHQFATMLYLMLYFYMVLVGNNLIPALFCTLAQMAIMEKEVQQFVREKVVNAVCPNCGISQIQHNESQVSRMEPLQTLNNINKKSRKKSKEFGVQMSVQSPKLSPYIRPRLNSPRYTPQSYQQHKVTNNSMINAQSPLRSKNHVKIQIVEAVDYKNHDQLMRFKMEKFYMMSIKLKDIAMRMDPGCDATWKRKQLGKIQSTNLKILAHCS